MHDLRSVLSAAVDQLPADFHRTHARLWHPTHLGRLADRLAGWQIDGRPDPAVAARPFRAALAAWDQPDADAELVARAFAAAMLEAGCAGLLLALGQRRTPTSRTDAAGIPPTDAELTAAAAVRHGPDPVLTAAGRALAEDGPTLVDRFRGAEDADPEALNAAAAELVAGILAGKEWWTVSGPTAAELTYEARLTSGHGAKWDAAGRRFIGFLDANGLTGA